MFMSDRSLCFQQHLAASKGHEDITLFLIKEGVDINIRGKFLYDKLSYLCTLCKSVTHVIVSHVAFICFA
jgi:ankyrin repeat protein